MIENIFQAYLATGNRLHSEHYSCTQKDYWYVSGVIYELRKQDLLDLRFQHRSLGSGVHCMGTVDVNR